MRYQNESLLVQTKTQAQQCRLAEITLIVVLPGVQLTSVAIAELLDRGIETLFLRQDGQFRGRLQGQFPTNPTIRPLLYPPQNRQLSLSQIILEQSRWVARCLCDRQLDYEPFVIR